MSLLRTKWDQVCFPVVFWRSVFRDVLLQHFSSNRFTHNITPIFYACQVFSERKSRTDVKHWSLTCLEGKSTKNLFACQPPISNSDKLEDVLWLSCNTIQSNDFLGYERRTLSFVSTHLIQAPFPFKFGSYLFFLLHRIVLC